MKQPRIYMHVKSEKLYKPHDATRENEKPVYLVPLEHNGYGRARKVSMSKNFELLPVLDLDALASNHDGWQKLIQAEQTSQPQD